MTDLFVDFQRMNGTTWFYLSFLLMLTVFFRFTRFFSIRNLDLVALFLFVPGLLACVQAEKLEAIEAARGESPREAANGPAQSLEWQGYVWLFSACGYWLARSLIDVALTRRPRIEPNLNAAGLAVLSVALFGFMMYEVLTKEVKPSMGRSGGPRRNSTGADLDRPADGSSLATPVFMTPLWAMVHGVADRFQKEAPLAPSELELGVARSMACLCHLLIMAGLFAIGFRLFDSSLYGIGMATLYLLLPMTAINVEKVDHLLPSALLVWAIASYRFPIVSGAFFGLSTLYVYPLFLAPLWASFYWRRGAGRFLMAALAAAMLLGLVIRLTEPPSSFWQLWAGSTAWRAWDFRPPPGALGFWSSATQFYRLPIFVVFAACCFAVAVWPHNKNLADLIALSAAIILGTQFWYANRGGTYVGWFVPLLILIAFRPNLDSHVPSAPGPLRWRWPALSSRTRQATS